MIRLLLLLALLAPVVQAQAGRVEIETRPTLPVAGQTADAVVRFFDTRPSNVSLFVRATGTTAFREVPGVETSPSVFTASVGEVPPQGVEAFAQYVLDGQTFTEPAIDPDIRPFRVPAFHPRLSSTQLLPARQHRMISVPLVLGSTGELTLGSDDPGEVLLDDFGDGADPARWRLLRFDPSMDAALDYATDPEGVGPFRPGRGYWLITATGGRFDADQGLSAGVEFKGRPFPVSITVELQPGWNQIGNPFLFPVNWDDVGGTAGVQDPVAFRGGYLPAQTVLEPWEGYFVFNEGESTLVEFDALPRPPGGDERSPEETLLDRAGPGGALVTVTASHDGATDLVYLVTGGRALRKPPPIDAGLRLAALADGVEQAAAVGPNTWLLSLRTAGETTLSFRALGTDEPVRLDDLDAGTEIAVVAGRAVVSPGPSVRTLRVRVGGASSAAPALGRPHPNPSRGALTIPLALPSAMHVRADVVDPLGRVVGVLHDGALDAGSHTLRWSGRADDGADVAAGVYLVRLSTPAGQAVARATILR